MKCKRCAESDKTGRKKIQNFECFVGVSTTVLSEGKIMIKYFSRGINKYFIFISAMQFALTMALHASDEPIIAIF